MMRLRCIFTKGFTLLEVLVALAIITISLSAAIRVVAENTNTTIYLKEKTMAEWVALNKIVELRLKHQWPAAGVSNGTADMGDVTWKWTLEVKDTPDQTVRRLEVSVKPESQKSDESTAFVVAFIGKSG